ncbi:MAG: ThiF family adenylyltransferase, partial [Candidatus Thorarchaeota archaeon]
LSQQEKKLFDRQLRLPGWNQSLLKNSTVLIVGVGGLGVEVAKNLAMAGIGHLILVDMDTIEFSNFNRQILFVGATEGSFKAEVASKKLKEINPFIKISAYNCALQDLDPIIYQQADLYIAGLDSINARVELNRRAIHNKKPLIDAGTAAYNGHIYCIFPFRNACLDCDPLHEREIDQLGACTLVGNPRKPVHCVLQAKMRFEEEFDKEPDVFNNQDLQYLRKVSNEILYKHFPQEKPFSSDYIVQLVDAHEPTVITINAVMASLQSQEAIKILHQIRNPENQRMGSLNLNYIIYNGLTGKFYEIEKPRNQKCTICGNERYPLFKVKVKPNVSFKQIIDQLVKKKNYKIDPEFPVTVFRIDSSKGMEELSSEQSLGDLNIRNFETVMLLGLEEDKSAYLQVKMDG